MKAILEFNLDDADDRMAHLRCVKATEMALVIWEFFYNDLKKFDAEINDAFTARLNEQGIIIDDLIN